MKLEIEILRKHFGSYEALAQELGITSRTLLNVRKGKTQSKPLLNLIKERAENISDTMKQK